MKNLKILAGAIVLSSGLFATEAMAQTCTTAIPFNTPTSGPTAAGTTCGAADSVALYCGSLDSAAKPDVIYQATLAAEGDPSRTATQITITGAGFTASAFLYNSTCVSGDACKASGDIDGAMSLAGVAAGTYFLAVSASPVDGADACGTYVITADGTLPVALQNFSVE